MYIDGSYLYTEEHIILGTGSKLVRNVHTRFLEAMDQLHLEGSHVEHLIMNIPQGKLGILTLQNSVLEDSLAITSDDPTKPTYLKVNSASQTVYLKFFESYITPIRRPISPLPTPPTTPGNKAWI